MTARAVELGGSPPRSLNAFLNKVPARGWSAALVGVYLAIVTTTLVRHVMWRDEAQMWLVGRASDSLGALFANMEYENRPALWFLLVWPISKVSGNPEAIKLITLLAAAGSALIISRWLPLKRIEQVAVLGGFLFLLGYSTVSTGYMLGTLATLLWFVAYSRGSLVGQFSFAAVMAATHVLFLMIAAPLWILTFTLLVVATVRRRSAALVLPWIVAGASAVVFLWSAWLILPPVDYGYAVSRRVPLAEAPLRMLEYAGAAVVAPGSPSTLHLSVVPVWVFAVPVALVAIVGLIRGRAWLVAPVVGLVLLLANGVFGYGPYWWHSGVVVVALLLIVLMTRQQVGAGWFSGPMLIQSLAWCFILVIQVVASFSAPGTDLWGAVPYSGSKAAAQVVVEACPDGCPIVTNEDLASTGVSAYLGGTSLLDVGTGREGTFTVWNADRLVTRPVSWNVVREALLIRGPNSVAVLSNMFDPPAGFTVLAEPVEAVLPEEAFLVVRLDHDEP